MHVNFYIKQSGLNRMYTYYRKDAIGLKAELCNSSFYYWNTWQSIRKM